MYTKKILLNNCRELREAYKNGLLGNMKMPEDIHPIFSEMTGEERIFYFTLPMSLNYQRNSYTLWESVFLTWEDIESKKIFSVSSSANMKEEELRQYLLKHKIALQPNKHIGTWKKISRTIFDNWGSIENLLRACNCDFLKLQNIVQREYKSGFPYISGPKIFHYWCFILGEYCDIKLKNRNFIEIAPDTHVLQCSIKLGVITSEQAEILSKDEISKIWRELLEGTELSPIDMHSPLWFWSRNNFQYILIS